MPAQIRKTLAGWRIAALVAAVSVGGLVAAGCSAGTQASSAGFCTHVTAVGVNISTSFAPAIPVTNSASLTKDDFITQDRHLVEYMTNAANDSRQAASTSPNAAVASKFNGFAGQIDKFIVAGKAALTRLDNLPPTATQAQVNATQEPLSAVAAKSPVISPGQYFAPVRSTLEKECPVKSTTSTTTKK